MLEKRAAFKYYIKDKIGENFKWILQCERFLGLKALFEVHELFNTLTTSRA